MSFHFPLALIFIQHLLAALAIKSPKNSLLTDQNALISQKNHITHDPSNILTKNWSSSSSVCEWTGVTCSLRHRRVTGLSISGIGLIGTVAPQLGNLSFLVQLDLSQNYFTGTIPPELGHLRRLRILRLRVNNLTGEIPPSIGLLKNVQLFSIARNSISGVIPSSIGNMSSLQVLGLSFNLLRGNIPQEIGDLQNLRMLAIDDNQISGSFPLEMLNISALQLISLSTNRLTGSLPDSICHRLRKLSTLNLSENQLKGPLPMNISGCSEFLVLSLSSNNFTGVIPKDIGSLKRLQELYLGYNQLEGVIPTEIGNLTMLKLLSLENNHLTGSIPACIFNLSKLALISLENNSFSGNLPSSLGSNLPNLEKFYASYNNLSGQIPNSIGNASQLQNIELGVNNFMGPVPLSLGNLRFLEWLNLGENRLTGDLGFISSLVNCKQLIKLGFNDNPLEGIIPHSIGNLSSSMEKLIAYNCRIMGNIPQEISNLTSLIMFDLDLNQLVGSVPHSIRFLQNLQYLSFITNSLSGEIPNGLCSLKSLYFLGLSENRISGGIPECVGNMTSLRYLRFGSNLLDSYVPPSLWNLHDLLELNLSSNCLKGSLPPQIGNSEVVTLVDLSRNQFSGDLPSTIGKWKAISTLSLAQNGFNGSVPDSFEDMLNLEILDLSHNNFSGMIPKSMELLRHLKYLNVSFNKLSGAIPLQGPFGNFTAETFISNEALCGPPRFNLSPCPNNSTNRSAHKRLVRNPGFWVGTSVGTGLILLAALVYFAYIRTKKALNKEELWSAKTPARISIYELQKATEQFDERNLLGQGSFGSVYKGTFDENRVFAVKVFNLQLEGAFKSFDRECEVLRNVRHRNLAEVISCCSSPDFKAIVLEYMPNGSLDKWLYSENISLRIMQRLSIMIDVACALQYLHSDSFPAIVHSDLKPSNILIDEEMVAHLSDFGMGRLLGQEGIAYTMTLATMGYIAPEFGMAGLVSTKCDVYSYGITLMETLTRKRPSDEMFRENMNMRDWILSYWPSSLAEIIDDDLLKTAEEHYDSTLECVSMIMNIALDCTVESPADRSNMEDIVVALNKIKVKFSTLS